MKLYSPSLTTSLLGAFFILSLVSGCATVDEKIALEYTPLKQSRVTQGRSIAVVYQESRAAAKNSQGEWIIGAINNVHGVPLANILSDRSMVVWVTDALLLELRRAGYNAIRSNTPTSSASGILITDFNAFLNINEGTVSDEIKHELRFTVDVFQNGVKTKTFSVASRDSRTVPLSASTEEQEQMMDHSLQDAMQQVIPEIIALTGQ